MNARKIEMNINEITNVDKKKEELKESTEINMASTNPSSSSSSPSSTNRIISKTIRVARESRPSQVQQAHAAEVEVPVPECKVCFEKYNKSNHMPIKCTSCDFEACRQCHSTFILDTTNAIPNCMNCHKELQREFLVENFTQKFVTQDWKKHREQIIFQRERALLPTRQPVAEMVRRKDVLKRENEELLKQMNELRAKQYQCQREIGNIDYRIRMGPAADANLRNNASGSASAPHAAAFIRPCPNTASSCRGFLSTQWKCNLCNMWACKDCHEIKGTTQDAPHECNPENLASAKLIDAETRPCPKCGARVFKISGCNQMFCTACNDCAFDWVTGRIETIIHNPHYFEFQRQRNGGQAPRVLGDILCGREVDHATTHTITMDLFPREEISRMIVVWRNTNRDMYGNITITAQKRWEKFYDDCIKNVGRILWAANTANAATAAGEVAIRANTQKMNCYRQILFRKLQFREICRLIIEIRQVTLPQHRIDPLRYNEELGVKYLLGELSEKDFATALQRSDKKMQKSRDIQNILTMVLNTSTDIIFRFAEHLRTSRQGIAQNPNYVFDNNDFTIMDEIRELFNYANTCFERVSKNYQSTTSLKIGTSLDPNYWEDNGHVIYQFMASR
jgi:hypothetical protein